MQNKVQLCPASVAIAVGLLVVAAAFERDSFIAFLGGIILLIGAMVACTRHVAETIRAVNRPADEAWSEGYEAGFDKGWREGNAAARPILTVLRKDDADELGRTAAER